MMAVALMAQAVVEPAAPPVAVGDQEIVVTARKLSGRWRGQAATINDQTTCKTLRSTGDAKFDALGCQAMLACWPQFSPKIMAQYKIEVDAGRIKTKEDLQRLGKTGKLGALYRGVGQCVTPIFRASIRDEIKRRKAATA